MCETVGYGSTSCTLATRLPSVPVAVLPQVGVNLSGSEAVPNNPAKFWTRGVRNIVGRRICPNYCTSSLWNRKYLSTELFISFSVEIYSVPSPKAPTPRILASDFHQLNRAAGDDCRLQASDNDERPSAGGPHQKLVHQTLILDTRKLRVNARLRGVYYALPSIVTRPVWRSPKTLDGTGVTVITPSKPVRLRGRFDTLPSCGR
jgi:hypothetical protein